jgi:hypothetical protein
MCVPNHYIISKIVTFVPELFNKFAKVNNDICDHVYSDPYDHLTLIDISHKFVSDVNFRNDINNKKNIEKLLFIDRVSGILDKYRKNFDIYVLQRDDNYPYENYSYIYIKFENFPTELCDDPYIQTKKYFERNPERIHEYIKKISDKKIFNNEFFYGIFIDCALTDRHTCTKYRTTEWEIPENERNLYNHEFLKNYDTYKKMPSKNDALCIYDPPKNLMPDLKKRMEIAKNFLDEFGGFVTGSSALAFFNDEHNLSLNFIPDDIDVVLNNKDIYEHCRSKYKKTRQYMHYVNYDDGPQFLDVDYIEYKGFEINIIFSEKNPEEVVKTFDFDFCKLLWNGTFDHSSEISLCAALYGKTVIKLDQVYDKPERTEKYISRGYEIIII